MTKRNLDVGELVRFTTEKWEGSTGVVSQPITEESPGHVLVNSTGHILGVQVSIDDVDLAKVSDEGFAQLAYNLIKLGSQVLADRLI